MSSSLHQNIPFAPQTSIAGAMAGTATGNGRPASPVSSRFDPVNRSPRNVPDSPSAQHSTTSDLAAFLLSTGPGEPPPGAVRTPDRGGARQGARNGGRKRSLMDKAKGAIRLQSKPSLSTLQADPNEQGSGGDKKASKKEEGFDHQLLMAGMTKKVLPNGMFFSRGCPYWVYGSPCLLLRLLGRSYFVIPGQSDTDGRGSAPKNLRPSPSYSSILTRKISRSSLCSAPASPAAMKLQMPPSPPMSSPPRPPRTPRDAGSAAGASRKADHTPPKRSQNHTHQDRKTDSRTPLHKTKSAVTSSGELGSPTQERLQPAATKGRSNSVADNSMTPTTWSDSRPGPHRGAMLHSSMPTKDGSVPSGSPRMAGRPSLDSLGSHGSLKRKPVPLSYEDARPASTTEPEFVPKIESDQPVASTPATHTATAADSTQTRASAPASPAKKVSVSTGSQPRAEKEWTTEMDAIALIPPTIRGRSSSLATKQTPTRSDTQETLTTSPSADNSQAPRAEGKKVPAAEKPTAADSQRVSQPPRGPDGQQIRPTTSAQRNDRPSGLVSATQSQARPISMPPVSPLANGKEDPASKIPLRATTRPSTVESTGPPIVFAPADFARQRRGSADTGPSNSSSSSPRSSPGRRAGLRLKPIDQVGEEAGAEITSVQPKSSSDSAPAELDTGVEGNTFDVQSSPALLHFDGPTPPLGMNEPTKLPRLPAGTGPQVLRRGSCSRRVSHTDADARQERKIPIQKASATATEPSRDRASTQSRRRSSVRTTVLSDGAVSGFTHKRETSSRLERPSTMPTYKRPTTNGTAIDTMVDEVGFVHAPIQPIDLQKESALADTLDTKLANVNGSSPRIDAKLSPASPSNLLYAALQAEEARCERAQELMQRCITAFDAFDYQTLSSSMDDGESELDNLLYDLRTFVGGQTVETPVVPLVKAKAKHQCSGNEVSSSVVRLDTSQLTGVQIERLRQAAALAA